MKQAITTNQMTRTLGIAALGVCLALPVMAQQMKEKPAAEPQQRVELSAAQRAQEHAAINTELEAVAREIATLLKHPGFRGQLRGEINGAKTIEGIIDLDGFLAKVAKQKKGPPGLDKARGATGKAMARISSSKAWDLEGVDLYFPVEGHKAKWKGNDDLLVAYSPTDDEKDIKNIVAFSVKTQKRVVLDGAAPPATPVLMVAPEEHETHEGPVVARSLEEVVLPADDSKPHVTGENPGPPADPQNDGHSVWGIKYLKLLKDGEHWSRGSPEIEIQLFQVKGNYCSRRKSDAPNVNKEKVWYFTWYFYPNANPPTQMSYDDTYENKVMVYVHERDGGSYDPHLYTYIKPGVTCSVYRRSGDDYIQMTTMYKTSFAYKYDYYHYMSNAYLVWYKVQ